MKVNKNMLKYMAHNKFLCENESTRFCTISSKETKAGQKP